MNQSLILDQLHDGQHGIDIVHHLEEHSDPESFVASSTGVLYSSLQPTLVFYIILCGCGFVLL